MNYKMIEMDWSTEELEALGSESSFSEYNPNLDYKSMFDFRYRGFEGDVELCLETNMYIGKLIYPKDISITFQADHFTDAHWAFEDAVDDYLGTNNE